MLIVFAATAALLLPSAQPAQAAPVTYVVNSTLDSVDLVNHCTGSGDCTLRSAVIKANANPGHDTIQILPGTYTLSLTSGSSDSDFGDLDITEGVTLVGMGGQASDVVIQAGGTLNDKVMAIIAGLGDPVYEIQNLTMQNGNNKNPYDGTAESIGGGLVFDSQSVGRLTIINAVFQNNSADWDGGGLALIDTSYLGMTPAVTIINSTISGNSARNGVGGGALIGYLIPVDISNSTISNNNSGGTGPSPGSGVLASGGGIYFDDAGGTSSITNSIFSGNKAYGDTSLGYGDGGGILSGRALTISGTTFSANESGRDGGGFYASTLASHAHTLTNVIVQGNSATRHGGGLYTTGAGSVSVYESTVSANTAAQSGGGFYAADASNHTLTNVTISGNTAAAGGGFYQGSTGGASHLNVTIANNRADSGGGIHRAAGNMTIHNTIVGGNLDSSGISVNDVQGALNVASSHNLIGTGGAGGLTNGANGNIVGASVAQVGLQPLGNYGGRVQTHALAGGSLAPDAGNSALMTRPTDARGPGYLRKLDAGDVDTIDQVDIGAYEAHPAVGVIADQSVIQDPPAPLTIPVHIGDVDLGIDSATLSVVSDPSGSIQSAILTGSGAQRTLTITPTPGKHGTATIRVTVSNNYNGMLHTMEESFVVTVEPRPDLRVSKTHTGSFRQGDQNKTYTITVSNPGAGATRLPGDPLLPDASQVTLTDTLPAGLVPESGVGTDWDCSVSGQTLSCTYDSVIAAGASASPITLTVDVADDAAASLTNTVAVSGGGELAATTDDNTATDPTTITQTANLSVIKSHTDTFRQGDAGLTYSILVANAGPGPTDAPFTVTDTLPTGIIPKAAAGTGFACEIDGQNVACTRSTALAAGANATLTLTVDVARDAAESLTNTASVSGGGELPSRAGDNSSSDPTSITQMPDLTLAKVPVGTFRQGQAAQYTLTVTNSGFAATSGTVTVTDTLPTGLTPVSASGTNWECSVTGQALSCTTDQTRGAGLSFDPITLNLTVAADAPTSVTNTASVSGGGQTYTANDTGSHTASIEQAADLVLAKADGGVTFTQGQTGTYTLTVTNQGLGSTVGAVTVTEQPGANLTVTGMSGTGWDCSAGTSCTRSDTLANGDSYESITVSVLVDDYSPLTVSNTATVSGGAEVIITNNEATDTTVVSQRPDLVVSKSHSDPFRQGQTGARYTLTVENTGTGLTTGTVSVTDTLPAGLTATAISGTGWNCNLATLTCTRSDELAAGARYPDITVTVTVANNAAASLTNTVTVAGGGDVDTTNNTDDDLTTVTQVADLTIAKTHTGDFRQGQTGATYTLTVSNIGPGKTDAAVTVTDTLPAGLTATAISGTGWTCTLSTLTCTRSDVLPSGASYPAITVTAEVAANAAPSLTNTVNVSGGGEINGANNSASDPTTVTQVADLTISKSHSDPFRQGQTGATYTLTVSNVGPGPTDTAVTVADTLPSGLTATAISGTGWSCDLGTLECTRSDSLAAGESYSDIMIVVNVGSMAGPSLTNTAAVSGGGQINLVNDSATDPTSVVQVADLTITKQHAGNFVKGRSGTYTLTVSNVGPGSTDGDVTVTDTLPALLTPTELSGDGWTCDLATLTCTRTDVLEAGGSYPAILLQVSVPSNAAGPVVNEVTVSGGGEINLVNNTASDPTQIVPPPAAPAPTPWVQITVPTTLTREDRITVSGATLSSAQVQVNGQSVTANALGSFSVTVGLEEGENLIQATVEGASDSVTVTRDSIRPVLTLTASAAETDTDSVVLTASSEEGARVTIQGEVTTTLTVPLSLGNNHFSATATDAAGNQATATVSVKRVASQPDRMTDEMEPGESTTLETEFVIVSVIPTVFTDRVILVVQEFEPGEASKKAETAGEAVVFAEVTAVRQSDNQPIHNLNDYMTITFPYDPDQVPDPSKLRIYYFDPTSKVWVEIGGVVDAEAHSISVRVNHLTLFAAMVPVEEAPIIDPLPATVAEEGLTVTGTAPSGTPVTLMVNGEERATATVGKDGRFTLEATLADGPNRLYVKGIGALASQEATVIYQTFSYTDIDEHWAFDAIKRLHKMDVATIYEGDLFQPEARVTRLEFAVMVARVLKLSPVNEAPAFTDTAEMPAWSHPEVAAAVKAGIINGMPDGSFAPNELVTRAQMAVMLTRALKYAGLDTTPGDKAFGDGSQIPDWARAQVLTAARYGLITGYPDGSFQSANTTTRAEAITMLYRLLNAVLPK